MCVQKFNSRSTAGIVFFVLLAGASCNEKKGVIPPEPRIAKTVPPVYKKNTDSGFANHQDTVYYNGRFFTGYRYGIYENGDTSVLQSYFKWDRGGHAKKMVCQPATRGGKVLYQW